MAADDDFAGSAQGFEDGGEITGLYRAVALTPALTWADWRVKEAVLRERCGAPMAIELTDEVNAALAASLLDDAAALLKGDGLALAA